MPLHNVNHTYDDFISSIINLLMFQTCHGDDTQLRYMLRLSQLSEDGTTSLLNLCVEW